MVLPLLQRRCHLKLLLAVCHQSQVLKLIPKNQSLLNPWKKKSTRCSKNLNRQLNSKLSNKGKISPLKMKSPKRKRKKNLNSSISNTKRANSSKLSNRAKRSLSFRILHRQLPIWCTPWPKVRHQSPRPSHSSMPPPLQPNQSNKKNQQLPLKRNQNPLANFQVSSKESKSLRVKSPRSDSKNNTLFKDY